MAQLLFVNASQVVTCAGPARARRGPEMRDAGVLSGVAVAVDGESIKAVGPEADLKRAYPRAERVDCARALLAPGLVDSHTHAIFGRPRYEEQELRAGGLDYMEIATRGGGIHSSVRDLRARDESELYTLAAPRLAALASYGVTTVEVKSGYGLTVEDELKTLRVVARLGRDLPLRIVATWLGAHEIPLEHRATPDGRSRYIHLLLDEMLPRVAGERLARFADVFCETGVYTPA
ncbi:MAG: imidazolonepropionase, partial [Gemmatimonadota bacterium]|nr:imidazolonepropionase [Gemmatimonadota bacterium]